MPTIETPPQPFSARGKRRVGVEIEFGGIGCARAAACVRDCFGGTVVECSTNDYHVETPRFGIFKVKLDWRYAHFTDGGTARRAEEGSFLDAVKENLADLVGSAGSAVMPYEIVAPPIPFDELHRLDTLLAGLRAEGARDTTNWLHAFALQLNPEAPSLAVRDVLATIQAYLLMSERLRGEIGVDLTRRLSTFIEPFPRSYARKVLAPDYDPDPATLIDNYLADNPTRNRELDLLPLFAWLDEARVRERLDDHRIKPRPTYHYRLPDCRLTDPAWSVGLEWNRWVRVEWLAADRPRLRELADAFLAHDARDAWSRISALRLP